MLRRISMRKGAVYTIDLAETDRNGAFPCPKCGATISPDDKTQEIYHIIETKSEDDNLTELILVCNKCDSTIRLVGFLQPET